jgi:hypothetical protein
MEEERKDIIINDLLNHLNCDDWASVNTKDFRHKHNLVLDELSNISKWLVREEYIKTLDSAHLNLKLDKLGEEIQNNGGWINYKKEIEIKQQKEKDLIDINLELAQSNIDSNNENSETRGITIRNSITTKNVAILTLVVLVFQVIFSIYIQRNLDKSQLKVEIKEVELKTKNEQLKLYVQKVDSLTFLLSNRKFYKKESKE